MILKAPLAIFLVMAGFFSIVFAPASDMSRRKPSRAQVKEDVARAILDISQRVPEAIREITRLQDALLEVGRQIIEGNGSILEKGSMDELLECSKSLEDVELLVQQNAQRFSEAAAGIQKFKMKVS